MKIDLNVNLTNLDGVALVQRVQHPDGKIAVNTKGETIYDNGQPVIESVDQKLVGRDLVVTSLLQLYADETALNAEDKERRYELASKINAVKEGAVDINLEEALLAKQLCAKLYAPLIFGQLAKILKG
jgi:hypothetical protein